MCPECGGHCYSRKTKTPEWRCRKCGHECDEQDLVEPAKPNVYSREFDPVLAEQYRKSWIDSVFPEVLGTDEPSQRIWQIGRTMLLQPDSAGTIATTDLSIFKHLFENRGRTVTYDELFAIWRPFTGDVQEIPTDPKGREWAYLNLDQRMANIRKLVERFPQNPTIILKRYGSGYAMPDTGQTPWNDEGPILERHQVVAIRRTIVGVLGGIVQGLWILILAFLIIIGLIIIALLPG